MLEFSTYFLIFTAACFMTSLFLSVNEEVAEEELTPSCGFFAHGTTHN